ncbi:GntR family transcriptional regulator [Micromonospora sp. WMMD1155]|uniref:GntR family transcriptional regulator n=1 Tax=Micromonospora sp. WMMD1155 TaxID=3016094 RepID=UPI00249AEE82|nr:GntR family transcriptional regulator [Micromonospora sp. WMMD1155]WFE52184.1 GntR family transcriptional regulator [Micromonospora sp. WMMD1155]
MTSPLSSVPIYRQLADLLAKQIEEGKLRPGQPLPSELHLQQTYGVARGTVRMAMRELRDRGLVVTVHAKGTFVVEQS